MIKKKTYVAPVLELLLTKFEKNFCESEFESTDWREGQTDWFHDGNNR